MEKPIRCHWDMCRQVTISTWTSQTVPSLPAGQAQKSGGGGKSKVSGGEGAEERLSEYPSGSHAHFAIFGLFTVFTAQKVTLAMAGWRRWRGRWRRSRGFSRGSWRSPTWRRRRGMRRRIFCSLSGPFRCESAKKILWFFHLFQTFLVSRTWLTIPSKAKMWRRNSNWSTDSNHFCKQEIPAECPRLASLW